MRRRLPTLLPVLAVLVTGCTDDEATSSPPSSAAASSVSASSAASAGSGGEGARGSGAAGAGGAGAGGGRMALVDCSASSGILPPLQLVPVASGLTEPLLAKSSPADPSRLYVAEQPGRVRVIKGGNLLADPFLDIASLVFTSGEGGLLGLAFHPGFEDNGRFFVHYTAQPASDSVIAEYHATPGSDVADAMPVGVVLQYDQPNLSHNAGSLEFGHDGMLYVSFGDGATFVDEANNGQSTATWSGKILRLDVSVAPYAIPPGNLTTPGSLPEIWDWGFRNPWKITFDACTGDLYIGDVGYVGWEEINVEASGDGLRNYGWHLKEGFGCFNPPQDCDPTGMTTSPVLEYDNPWPDGGDAAVIAGYVYRGSAIPALRGTFFYADYAAGRIWSFVYAGGMATEHTERTDDLGSTGMLITSLGQDAIGEVYVVDGGAGAVHRIAAE